MKNIVTAGKFKGREYVGRFGFENCTVSQETYKNNKEVIIIKYSDGTLSGALRKYPTLEETVRDWKYVMIQNGEEEEQVQIAIDKIKPFFE